VLLGALVEEWVEVGLMMLELVALIVVGLVQVGSVEVKLLFEMVSGHRI